MNIIEKHLHEHFLSIQEADDVGPTSTSNPAIFGDSIPATLEESFAKVNSIVPGSPAESAGLKPGDEIRNFGYVNKSNHDGLKKVAECVQGNEGVSQSLLGLQRGHHLISISNCQHSNESSSKYLAEPSRVKDKSSS